MRRLAWLPAVLACTVALALPAGEAPRPVAFFAEARVEVDADGKVVKVDAAQDLPASIRTYIEQELKTWQYARRHREGETGNAATWVSLGACAVPTDKGGYTMGLAYHGNGPRIAGGGRWQVTSGLANAVGKSGFEGDATVHFVVNADGTTKVESVEGLDDKRARKAILPAVEFWLERMRFDPEEIGGKPVATRETVPLRFKQGGRHESREDTEARLKAEAMQSPQCKLAAAAGQLVGPGLSAVAVDSVMDIVPSI
jgi:hypothetical protein